MKIKIYDADLMGNNELVCEGELNTADTKKDNQCTVDLKLNDKPTGG